MTTQRTKVTPATTASKVTPMIEDNLDDLFLQDDEEAAPAPVVTRTARTATTKTAAPPVKTPAKPSANKAVETLKSLFKNSDDLIVTPRFVAVGTSLAEKFTFASEDEKQEARAKYQIGALFDSSNSEQMTGMRAIFDQAKSLRQTQFPDEENVTVPTWSKFDKDYFNYLFNGTRPRKMYFKTDYIVDYVDVLTATVYKNDVERLSQIKDGNICRAILSLSTYNNKAKGVRLILLGIVKVGEGEPIKSFSSSLALNTDIEVNPDDLDGL